MQLVSFDFKTIIFSILMFLSGCVAFQPPEQTSIQTQKTTTVTKLDEFAPGMLKIIFKTNQTIELLFKETSGKEMRRLLSDPTSVEIVNEIKNLVIKTPVTPLEMYG